MTSIEISLSPDGPLTREEEGQIALWCEWQNAESWRYADCKNKACQEVYAQTVRRGIR